jgi:CheY-like chemotaxis protein
MESKSKKRVLIVEDESNWQQVISELLQDVARAIGCTVRVVIAGSFEEALIHIGGNVSFDCVTIDNKLPDGYMAKILLDRIARLDQKVPAVVVSGAVNPKDVRDFFRDYKVAEFFWKTDFKPEEFRQTLIKLLAPAAQGENQKLPPGEGEVKHMDWNTIISTAVSVLSPYANALAVGTATAAGTKLGEAASERVKEIWQRICQLVGQSDDESAKHVLESFQQNPQSNKDALADIIRQLSPDDDAVLRGYVQGLLQEVQLRKSAQLYSLLDDHNYYTFTDLKRICSRISTRWEDELGSDPPRDDLARWVVNHALARSRQQDLIAAMLEVNPTVMLQ